MPVEAIVLSIQKCMFYSTVVTYHEYRDCVGPSPKGGGGRGGGEGGRRGEGRRLGRRPLNPPLLHTAFRNCQNDRLLLCAVVY